MMEKLRMCATSVTAFYCEAIRGMRAYRSAGRRPESLAEPLIRARETLVERHPWLPAERLLGERGIDDAAPLLARLGGAVRGGERLSRKGNELRRQRHHVGLAARADVHRPDVVAVERRQIGAHQILDEHVVAGLPAVAVDARCLAADELFAENRHHAGFA